MYKRGNPRDRYIHPMDVTNGMIIKGLQINNENYDLNSNKRFIRDKALLIINLDEPILPGTVTNISASWEFHIPEKTSIRFGKYDSTSFFIAYWFPRVAVYDDIFGWDRYGYDGYLEMNNDFAEFKVAIDLPGDFLIWSTGNLLNSDEVLPFELMEKIKLSGSSNELITILGDIGNYHFDRQNEMLTWYFSSNSVTDFAFGFSDHHLWDVIPVTLNNGKRVLINVVYDPNGKEYLSKMTEFLSQCIKYYSEIAPGVPYPYESYTLFNGLNTGWHTGIEFPAYVNQAYLTNDTFNYAFTAHELAHSYFPFLVNINQAHFSWMDEGLANYLAYDIIKYILGLSEFHPLYSGNPLDKKSGLFLDVPVFTSSILYQVTATGSHTAYNRPSFAYVILEDVLGKELFNKCLVEFINRWRGKRPIPHDLFYTFNDVAEENLNWFWNPWFFEFAYPDLSIKGIENNEIIIKNLGKLPLPIYLKITYDDNSLEEISKTARIWKNGESKVKIKLANSKQINKIDLNDIYFIPDVNRSNNSYIYKN